jgi:hypothetical protein
MKAMQKTTNDAMLSWINSLKPSMLNFLSELRDDSKPGYYKYSLTGDIYSSNIKWGLGNVVFAAKTYYMLDAVEESDAKSIVKYIKSFQDKQGYFYDRKIKSLSRKRRVAFAFLRRNFHNFFNEQNKMGETRQSFAALLCLGSRPNIPFLHIPYTRNSIEKYIHSLNWKIPWEAGGIVNHLLFFLNYNRKLFNVYKDEVDWLIDHALNVINSYQQKDGAWYEPMCNVPDSLKVNGAMKILIAYESVERNDFNNPEGLIDLCLSTINDGHACNNLNIICVLYYCSQRTDYRIEEIKNFCIKRLEIYKKHYWPEHGGFSFFERKANNIYYGAEISKGLEEPDVHGTSLFLWGIILILRILGFENNVKLNIPFT